MSDLPVRRNSGSSSSSLSREPDFLNRALRQLMSWDPFLEMPAVGLPIEQRLTSFAPAFEVKETKTTYLFKADVPGVKEQDLEINVTGNRLSVSGKREEEREETGEAYYASERTYGSFTRMFTLPEGADVEHVHAELKGGVLTLAVPKMPEIQAKKVAITSGDVAKKS